MMANYNNRLILSVSLFCLLGGCALGKQSSLDIRSINHPQLTQPGERSIERGKAMLRLGQNTDAISAFRTALREETDSAEAHNGLAIAYGAIGRQDLARRYFELAVAENPGEARYRSNLVSFFENNDQPELAAGLLEHPIALASAELSIAPLTSIDVEEVIIVSDFAQSTDVNSIGIIIANLAVEPVNQETMSFAVEPESTPPFVLRLNEPAIQSVLAVFRPSVTPAITAARISLPSMPIPPRDPLDRRRDFTADLPRVQRKSATNTSPHIERISLGEVTLVTLPPLAKAEPAFDFDRLGTKLAQWAADEARKVEFQKSPGLNGRLAIQAALKRAATENETPSAVSLAAVVETITTDFVYIAFADDDLAADETAA